MQPEGEGILLETKEVLLRKKQGAIETLGPGSKGE